MDDFFVKTLDPPSRRVYCVEGTQEELLITPIKSGRMTIIPMIENDGWWALPNGEATCVEKMAICTAIGLSLLMGPDLTTEQRKHYIKNGGMGYAKS